MTSEVPLSAGRLREIIRTNSTELAPVVVQVLQVKTIGGDNGTPRRLRVIVSDGENYMQVMFQTHLSEKLEQQPLERGSIIAITSYVISSLASKQRSLIIVSDLDVLTQYGLREKLGSPGALAPDVADGNSAGQATGGTTFYGETRNSPAAPAAPVSAPAPSKKPDVSNAPLSKPVNTIDELSPYQNKWMIKARVTAKSAIREYHNARGAGKLFNVNFLDEKGEIRATGFNKAVDNFYDLLVVGQVYYVSGCRVTMAKKQFSNLANEYELMFEDSSVIELCADAGSAAIPQVRFNFVESLGKVAAVDKDSIVDVVAVVKEIRDAQQIVAKSTGRPFDKRDVVVVDESNYSIVLTAWGASAVDFPAKVGDVIAAKGAKVGDFNGRSLSLLQSSTLTVNPDIPESFKLRGWYQSSGQSAEFMTMQTTAGAMTGRPENLKTMQQVKDEQIGMNDTPDYFSVKGTITNITTDTFAYPACPKEGCNKKVIDEGGSWRCEKCNASYPEPSYRYVLRFNISDHTGQLWLSCFDDVGRIVMDMPADDLHALRDSDHLAFQRHVEKRSALMYTFRVRSKVDVYNNVTRARHSAMSATPLDFEKESKTLIDALSAMSV
ncbi:replication factor-a protein 1 [Myxozyma melibiosi]|uniref:Replication protein A subunit n=1 Tax=Myxozyma melibiosi TaxID=54550 RepID=A0ABR1FEJ3_9ASCO